MRTVAIGQAGFNQSTSVHFMTSNRVFSPKKASLKRLMRLIGDTQPAYVDIQTHRVFMFFQFPGRVKPGYTPPELDNRVVWYPGAQEFLGLKPKTKAIRSKRVEL